jgi:hypothetical protein
LTRNILVPVILAAEGHGGAAIGLAGRGPGALRDGASSVGTGADGIAGPVRSESVASSPGLGNEVSWRP